MKKTLTLLALAIAFSASAQVTNGGFEDWTTEFLYENPGDWETGNGQEGDGLVTTTKLTTMAPNGSFAVRLETMATADDTAFGFVFQGAIDDDPIGGIPWTTEIQNIEGFVRYDVQPNDTAIMLLAAWQGGSIVSEELIQFTGTQSTWMPFSHLLSSGAVTPDSVFIAAASSNALNEIGITPGSWLELDAIELTSSNEPNPDMIPNYDFENWMDVSSEDPDNWDSYNGLVAGLGFTSVDKSTDANSGSFSALIKTEAFNGDTLPGILTNGEITQNGPIGGIPYVAIPENFTGAYKYMPSGQDTARIACLLSNSGSIIGVASKDVGTATPSWTSFSEDIFLLLPPDSMTIIIWSGENPGSMLYVDDLDLTGGTVGIQALDKTELVCFPNPATDKVTILSTSDLGRSALSIIDLSGRVVLQQSGVLDTKAGYELDLSDLRSGSYILEISKEGQVIREQLIKE